MAYIMQLYFSPDTLCFDLIEFGIYNIYRSLYSLKVYCKILLNLRNDQCRINITVLLS